MVQAEAEVRETDPARLPLNLSLDLLRREDIIIRHPHYLEIPWDVHWERTEKGRSHHLWWLIALIVVLAMFLIGVGVTSGLI
jgi:hypothetical protein